MGFCFITDCSDGKDRELDYIVTGYFLGLNDMDGNDYEDCEEYNNCPHFSFYVIGSDNEGTGKQLAVIHGKEYIAWMNGGVNLL